MIETLTLRNFKAWRELDIRFGKVTALFGANSSGKSSLLQFLLMLKQTKNATDRRLVLDFGGPDKLANLGSFRDVVHRHNDDDAISWKLTWKLLGRYPLEIMLQADPRNEIFFEDSKLQTECEVGTRFSGLRAYKLSYTFGNTVFSLRPSSEKPSGFELYSNHRRFEFLPNRGKARPLPGPIKTHLFPDQASIFYRNSDFIEDFEYEYEELMDRIFYLGPLREYPKREYMWSGAMPEDVGQRGERTVDAILAATVHGEKRNLAKYKHYKPFQEFIAHWLKELGLIESFSIREIAPGSSLYRAMVKKNRASSEVLLTDVGFGVSQVLPALVLLFYVPKGSIVLMEQPEIHLHPSVQSGLADAIINAARTRDVQVIVESHSEHLMRRFQRRVAEDAEGEMPEVKLYFTSMAGRTAQLSDLKLNGFGEIENWPDNFFGDELGEIAKTRLATLQRKMNSKK